MALFLLAVEVLALLLGGVSGRDNYCDLDGQWYDPIFGRAAQVSRNRTDLPLDRVETCLPTCDGWDINLRLRF